MKSHFPKATAELLDCFECLDPRDSFSKFNVDKLFCLAKLYPEEFSADDYMFLRQELKSYIQFIKYGDRFTSLQDLESLADKIVKERVHKCFRLIFRLIELAVLYSSMNVTFCKFADYLL